MEAFIYLEKGIKFYHNIVLYIYIYIYIYANKNQKNMNVFMYPHVHAHILAFKGKKKIILAPKISCLNHLSGTSHRLVVTVTMTETSTDRRWRKDASVQPICFSVHISGYVKSIVSTYQVFERRKIIHIEAVEVVRKCIGYARIHYILVVEHAVR